MKLRKNDLVSWISEGETLYGRVNRINSKTALIDLEVPGRWGERISVPLAGLVYEPTIIIEKEELRRFARFEIGYTELKHGKPYADIDIPESYLITLEDLKEAVINCRRRGIDEKDFGFEYFWPLWEDIYGGVDIETALNGPDDVPTETLPVPNQYTVFSTAWDILLEKYEYETENIDLDDVIKEVQTWEDNRDKLYAEREYTEAQKHDFLNHWNDDRLEYSDEDIKEAYRKILDGLCQKDDIKALKIKAYACYGNGNAAYGQNWDESLKCLLRLMELDPNPQTANTLGYMYYYGRCNDGKPEYDKAFYYFSIGAAGWYYESRYKLADMFQHGYGVAKNPKAAATLIWELYDEQIKKICDGQFQSNFADVALRAGNIYRYGIDCLQNPDSAYYYYLQAQYAIRMRMLAEDNYGDASVAAGIEKAIEEILPETSYRKKKNTVHFSSLYFLLQNGLDKRHHMEMKISKVSETEFKLTFRIVPFENGEPQPKLFVTVPSAHFSGLLEKVTVRAKNVETFELIENTDTVLFDSVSWDGLYFYGKRVAEIDADFVYKVPSCKGRKYAFASVEFNSGGKRYDYLCDKTINVGDKVIVETADSEAEATVVAAFEKAESELALPLKCYRKVLKKA